MIKPLKGAPLQPGQPGNLPMVSQVSRAQNLLFKNRTNAAVSCHGYTSMAIGKNILAVLEEKHYSTFHQFEIEISTRTFASGYEAVKKHKISITFGYISFGVSLCTSPCGCDN